MRQKNSAPNTGSSRPYSISADLRYRALEGNLSGTGRTRAMSRHCVWFESESRLPSDLLVELAVAWPVRLEDKIPLKLVILGRTVAAEKHTCVEILRHEFRIHAARASDHKPSVVSASAGRAAAASA